VSPSWIIKPLYIIKYVSSQLVPGLQVVSVVKTDFLFG